MPVVQRFQEVQGARRDYLRAEADKLKAAGSSEQPECTDLQWAEAAGEPSVKALGASLNRGRHALAALIQSYTYAINKFASEYSRQVSPALVCLCLLSACPVGADICNTYYLAHSLRRSTPEYCMKIV